MTSIGDTLRKARERQGRTAAQIAEELCITQAYLIAIETGDVASLPGLFFYKSFARQYAAMMHLDESLVRPQLDALTVPEGPTPRPDIRMLDPIVESANRRHIPDIPLGLSIAALALVVLLCSGFYSWWTRTPQPATAQVSPIQIATPVSYTPEPAPAVPDTGVAQAETSQTATPSETPSAPVQTAAAASPAPESVNGIVLKLLATEKTWLSVSSGGKEIFSGFLEPSESKILSGLDIATMRVGNAAGIDVDWNGKPIGPLGTRGQVLTVRFTPEDFEIVPPKQL